MPKNSLCYLDESAPAPNYRIKKSKTRGQVTGEMRIEVLECHKAWRDTVFAGITGSLLKQNHRLKIRAAKNKLKQAEKRIKDYIEESLDIAEQLPAHTHKATIQ